MDFSIPMKQGPRVNGGGEQIPLSIDARLPMSVISPLDSMTRSVALAQSQESFQAQQAKNLEEQKIRQEKDRDKQLLNQYLQAGGDLYSATGMERAVYDLKGKISSTSYMNLTDMAQKRKDNELKFQENLTKLTDQQLTAAHVLQEARMQALAVPLKAYEEGMKRGGEADANQSFEKYKMDVLYALAEQKDAMGRPLAKPEELQRLQGMGYEQLKSEVQNSTWYRKIMKDEAETRYKNAQAKDKESLNGIKGNSIVAELRRMIAAGEISEEEGQELIRKSVTSGGAAKTWKPITAAGKLYRINKESTVQEQDELGEWADVSPKEMSKELIEAVGGKKAQSAITQRYNQRTVTAAAEVLRNLEMIGSMPVGATSGLFNYDKNGALTNLKHSLTSTEAEDLNTAMSGLSLELTTLLRGGMALNESEIQQIEKGAELRPGISVESARYKIANVVAKALTAMETFEPSTQQQSEQQKKLIDQYKKWPSPEQVLAENRGGKAVRTYADDMMDIKKRQPEIHSSAHDIVAQKAFPKVTPKEQAARDEDRVSILEAELADEEAKLAKAVSAEARSRHQANISSLRRELKKPEAAKLTPAPTPAKRMNLDQLDALLKSKGF